MNNVSAVKIMQARSYAQTDHLLAEEQWAQITVRFDGQNTSNERQYLMFERRLADKMSYQDWKLCTLDTEEEVRVI